MDEFTINKTDSIPFLTSKYVADSHIFYREKKAPLLVLVEDEDDICFWKKLFSIIGNHYHSIDVCTLKSPSAYALALLDENGQSLTDTGKDALMKVANLGTNKVVAVDADYDLLIDYHLYSERIRNDKYVIHTEYYSIENHLLQSSIIPLLSIWNDVQSYLPTTDWNAIFNSLATTVSNAVKLCVASVEHREKAYKDNPTSTNLPAKINVSDINSGVSSISFAPESYQTRLDDWRNSFENDSYKKILDECKEELKQYEGWSPDDVLHNIQGHTLYKFISKAILYYYSSAYDQLQSDEIGKVQDKTSIPDVIHQLKQRIGINSNKSEFIKDSIYSASALDMQDKAIEKIQKRIIEIPINI